MCRLDPISELYVEIWRVNFCNCSFSPSEIAVVEPDVAIRCEAAYILAIAMVKI